MPENFKQPHRPFSHRRYSWDESTLYNYLTLGSWAGSQAEWSALIRQEALGDDELEIPISQSGSKSTLVTFGFALILLCLSAVTLIWNAGRLTEAVVKVGENTMQEVTSPNHWSF